MNSFTKIVGHMKNYISHLQHSLTNHFKNLQTSWTISEVMHTLRQFIHFLILLTLLGLIIYLLPVGLNKV